jgi:hypothetical protein
MKRRIVVVLTAAAIWLGILPAMSAENSIIGTWQLTSFSLTVLDTKETSRLDHTTGYIQFSPGGHMVMFLTAGELKPPASGSYSDAELQFGDFTVRRGLLLHPPRTVIISVVAEVLPIADLAGHPTKAHSHRGSQACRGRLDARAHDKMVRRRRAREAEIVDF